MSLPPITEASDANIAAPLAEATSPTECQVRHTLRYLRELSENGHRFLDCHLAVHDANNDRVDAQHRRMIWTHQAMTNWYRNADGQVDIISPWRLVDYWEMTLEPDPADYARG